MSIASEIYRLSSAKAALKDAIVAKGVDVADSLKLDGYAEKVAAIPTGGDSDAEEKDVNFYLHTGKRVYSYTLEEFASLTSLPEVPNINGLVSQGWNFTIEELKSYNRKMNVGAIYITDDGSTRLYIKIDNNEYIKDFELIFKCSVIGGVKVSWGDGSEVANTTTSVESFKHTYANGGEYVISIKVTNGTIRFGHDSYYTAQLVSNTRHRQYVRKVEIGDKLFNNAIAGRSFQHFVKMESISIPNNVTRIEYTAISYCEKLKITILPKSVTYIEDGVFAEGYSRDVMCWSTGLTTIKGLSNNYNLKSVTFADGITSIDDLIRACQVEELVIPATVTKINNSSQPFAYCASLKKVVFLGHIGEIPQNCFASGHGGPRLMIVDLSHCTSIPILKGTTSAIPASVELGTKILVPADLYDQWVVADNWTALSDYIVAV